MTLEDQMAAWAAEDAAELACGQARAAYYAFTGGLDVALVDEAADYENSVDFAEGSLEFWQNMLRSAQFAAEDRKAEQS